MQTASVRGAFGWGVALQAGSIPDGAIWIFHWPINFRSHSGSWVNRASNRNEYQDYFLGVRVYRCIGLTTLPSSCANCLQIWWPRPHGTNRVCTGLYRDYVFLHSVRHSWDSKSKPPEYEAGLTTSKLSLLVSVIFTNDALQTHTNTKGVHEGLSSICIFSVTRVSYFVDCCT